MNIIFINASGVNIQLINIASLLEGGYHKANRAIYLIQRNIREIFYDSSKTAVIGDRVLYGLLAGSRWADWLSLDIRTLGLRSHMEISKIYGNRRCAPMNVDIQIR